MEMASIDLEKFDLVATKVTYYKLFEYMVEDFVTREDSKMMMKSSNLPVSTNVTSVVNTAVQVAGPAGTGTGVGKGTGTGTGRSTPIYNGGNMSPGSVALKAKYKAAEEAGGETIEGLKSGIETAAGL